MVLVPVFERQNISIVTKQRLRSAWTSFGLWPRSHCSVTKEILKPFESQYQYHIVLGLGKLINFSFNALLEWQ